MIVLDLAGARVLFTQREDGDARDPATLAQLARVTGRRIAHGRQVHGTHVRLVTGPSHAADEEADGLATSRQDVALLVRAADCLPVALVAEGAVAMIHAGWRGLAAGVLEQGVRALREVGGADPVQAAIGPGAGPCCYEVGDEVRVALGTTGQTADLKSVAGARLRAAGVSEVRDVGVCTICDTGNHSHRRDGAAAGRQAGIAWRA